ncbi:hypothetical protein Leryth_019098 [Lithospermum erythrorhizon]|nr:hypothetical protein Leryth_019098 [Lithospermum erythrorhizon]
MHRTISFAGVGFGNGAIDLGGLLVYQMKNLTEPLPDGFFVLGSYSQSHNNSPSGWYLAGKDTTNDPSRVILKSPIDYTIVKNVTSQAIKKYGGAYVWQPIPPKGYMALGNVATGSSDKPPLDKIRCVLSDFVEIQEYSDYIWGAGNATTSDSFNLHSSLREEVDGNYSSLPNMTTLDVPTGTSNSNTTSSVTYLKNVDGNYSSMPNMTQIDELIKKYSPVIYFHPDEQFFPSLVSYFFENGGLLYTKGNESNPVLIDPTGSNLPQGGSDDGLYWLDLPIDNAARGKVQSGDLGGAGAYIHVKPALGATCTDIAIWIFYPFNGPARAKINFFNVNLGKVGEHVGDWEHVTLRISNFNGELQSVYFAKYGKDLGRCTRIESNKAVQT